jgi:hypothetical protein
MCVFIAACGGGVVPVGRMGPALQLYGPKPLLTHRDSLLLLTVVIPVCLHGVARITSIVVNSANNVKSSHHNRWPIGPA